MNDTLSDSPVAQEAVGLGRHRRRAGAVLGGAAVFVAIFFLRREGILDGIPALVFGFALASLLPWFTSLSRRILVSGALFLGWIPLLWWVKLPVPQVDRVGIVLAAVAAILVAWILWTPGTRARMRRLLPRLTATDAMMFAAMLLAVWTVWPLLSSSSGADTLNVLFARGHDHVSHSAIAIQMRAQGAVLPVLAPPADGTAWVLLDYPQHFHASIVALTELYKGPVVGSTAAEILEYGRSLAMMQVVTAVLLTAGIAQLPNLRRRPGLAWPIAAMVLAAFLFGKGTWAFSMAWENFIWACALAGLATLMAVSMSREKALLRLLALGGLVIATAYSWTLLAPMTAVAACVSFLPWRGSPLLDSRRSRIVTIIVAAVTAAASAAVLLLLSGIHEGIGGILTVQNDYVPHGIDAISDLILTAGMAIAVGLAVYVRRQGSDYKARGIGLTAIPAVGLLTLVFLGIYQLANMGQFSYYFDKLLWGVGLVSVVVLAAALALHVNPVRPKRGPRVRAVAILASVIATAAALQLFGTQGLDQRSWSKDLIAEDRPAGHRILEAADIAESLPFASAVYVEVMPEGVKLTLYDMYKRGLSVMWSTGTWGVHPILRSVNYSDGVDIDEAVSMTEALLDRGADATVIVGPEVIDDIRERLPAEMRDRVVTWESS